MDPAAAIVDAFTVAMGEAFVSGESSCPPRGGKADRVWFFAGDGAIPAARGGECEEMVWVRVAHRYRSRPDQFPGAFVGVSPCGQADTVPVLAVEVGVARCTSMEHDPDWAVLRDEAMTSLDDSWRLSVVLCKVAARLREREHLLVATDTVVPTGPMGGVIVWTGMAYVQMRG